MADSADIFVAKDSFTTTLDGESVTIHKGVTRVRKGHPLLKGKESLFEPLRVHYDVEQATSAPAEKRGAPAPEPEPAPEVKPEPAPEPAPAAETPEKRAPGGLTTKSIKPAGDGEKGK